MNHLQLFQQFCEARGWMAEPPKGEYEVLRMRHPDQPLPLIVHLRSRATQHCTTWGHSEDLAYAFYDSRKRGEGGTQRVVSAAAELQRSGR